MGTGMKIAVAGATGRVGRHVVEVLEERGHEVVPFVPQMLAWGSRDGVAYMPRMRTQPVAARAVAEALADLATEPETGPAGAAAPVGEIAGLREEDMVELARLFVARRGDALEVEGVSDPSDPATEVYQSGALLPGPDAIIAGPTFREWLETDA